MKRSFLLFLALSTVYSQVDYGTEIQTILDNNCTSCHQNGGAYQNGLDLTSYDNLMAGDSDNGPVIIPGDHASSLLWQKISSGAMPPGNNEDLNSDEIDLIATWIDEGALETSAVDVSGLFFSEYGEGSSSNKYFEIYNGTGDEVELDNVVILGNYNGNPWSETFTFESGATIEAGGVYIVASSDADAAIIELADETHAYADPWYITAFNGDDVRALAEISGTDTTIIDIIGTLDGGDPGDGWDVAGVTNGTQDHTLVRNSSVTEGNSGDWASSAGTSEENSEWIVLDQNTWDYLGSHPHDMSGPTPTVVINELLASSENCCGVDIFGEAEDFVELFNHGTESVDITGWGFGDTEGEVETTAPDTSIPAGAFITLWYTGNDDAVFPEIDAKLSADGEAVYVADASGNAVDYVEFAEQTDDVSYGRVPDGSDTWEFVDPPTPGVTNVSVGEYTAIYDIQYVSDPDTDDASPLNGQEVTINGVVTAEFWGSDQYRYMHVQDAEGPWNGIVCFEYDGWDTFEWVDESGGSVPGPAEGDRVTMTGLVEEYYNLTELASVTSGIVHGESEEQIEPSLVSLSEIGEAYEGCLLRVEDVEVVNDDLGYGEWELVDSDGTFMTCDDKWDYFFFPIMTQELASVEGVLDYNFSTYKLQPRLARDVVEGSGLVRMQRVQQVLYSDLMKAGEDLVSDMSYMEGDTVTIEGIVTMPTGLSYAGEGVKFIFADVNGGPWSAILSYDPDSSAFPTLFEGDLIQATGFIDEYTTGPANMTELFITEPINIIDFEQSLPPIDTVDTGDLRWPTEAEQWGNVMVRVEDGIVTNNDFQYEVFSVDDGTGSVLVDDDSDSLASYFETVGPPPVGSLLQSMEGWLYHHYGSNEDSTAYKLCPLYVEDIQFGAGPPSISQLTRDPCAPISTDNEVMVSCVIRDNSTITEALVHYSIDEGEYITVAMTSDDDSTFTGVIPVSNTNTVYYYITATDDGVDQSEPKTSVYPYDIEYDQLGFIVDDMLFINDIQVTPWPSGNTRYEGCEVTISGVVTADTAQYNSGYSSYAMQEGSGQWDGIIFDTEEVVDVSRGDHVTVTGLITDNDPDWIFKFGGNTRLINAEVTIDSQVDIPDALVASCEDLAQTAEEVESYEGVLVKLNNVTVSSVNDFDWAITDASGLETLIDDDMANMSADNFMSTLVEGQNLDYVMGIFNYSFGTYKVQVRDLNDLGQTMGINDDVDVNPYEYALHNNFPNPFNPETQIRFSIGSQENVKLVIYDITGRQVRSLVDGEQYRSGFHVVNWDGLDSKGEKVPSGMYIYRIKAGDFIADKKMLLVK